MFFPLRTQIFSFVFCVFILIFLLDSCWAIHWLSLRTGAPPPGQGRCALARGLGITPCAALGPVAAAARLTRDACRGLFKYKRWNCASIDLAPHYTADLLLGTKEQSFVYSLSSAALMHTLSRACSSGILSSCTCGIPPRRRPGRGFKWGGCSDNLKWATRFVRQFAEVPERLEEYSRSSVQKEIRIYDTADRRIDRNGNLIEPTEPGIVTKTKNGFKKMPVVTSGNGTIKDDKINENDDNQEVTTVENAESTADFDDLDGATTNEATLVRRDLKKRRKLRRQKTKRPKKAFDTKETLQEKLERLQPYITLANLQNSKVGRKLVERSVRTECKCHGVSGSCSIRTCWRALPPFNAIAYALMDSVADAARVRPARPPRHYAIGRRGTTSKRSLLFVTPSPDYCKKDLTLGSVGTSGRWCNGTLTQGDSSCRSLCCGRGFQTHSSSKIERCACKYIWCCRVECQVCKITTDTHYCN